MISVSHSLIHLLGRVCSRVVVGVVARYCDSRSHLRRRADVRAFGLSACRAFGWRLGAGSCEHPARMFAAAAPAKAKAVYAIHRDLAAAIYSGRANAEPDANRSPAIRPSRLIPLGFASLEVRRSSFERHPSRDAAGQVGAVNEQWRALCRQPDEGWPFELARLKRAIARCV